MVGVRVLTSRLFILFQKSSPPLSLASVPYQPPWPILVAMPTYPFLPTQSNNELLPFNNTNMSVNVSNNDNNHSNNANNSASNVDADYKPQLVTTTKSKEEISSKNTDIPSDVVSNYKLPINTTEESETNVNSSTINLTQGKSSSTKILTKPSAADHLFSNDTTDKHYTEVTTKMNDNSIKMSKPTTEEDTSKTSDTFEIDNGKENRLSLSAASIETKDKAVEFFDNILHGISHSTENNQTERTVDDEKYSKVSQQIIQPVLDKVNDIGNVLQQIKSTAAQLRLISKAMESDPKALKKSKENVSIVLHTKENTVNKNDTHEEIMDIYEKFPSVSRDEHVIKKVDYSNLELSDTDLFPLLFPTMGKNSQILSSNYGNSNKKEKTADNVKEIVAKNKNQSTKSILYADIKPLEAVRNLQKYTPLRNVQRKVTEAATSKRKSVARKKKNKNKLPEVTFSSFIPIFKPKGRHNQRKNDVTERHSASNDDVNIDVKVFDIPNRESPQNIQNFNKEIIQNKNSNAKQNLILNAELPSSGLINSNVLNTPQTQNQNVELRNQPVNSLEGKKLVIFKPEKVSMCNVYEDFLEKLTMTVLVPYHVYKLGNS